MCLQCEPENDHECCRLFKSVMEYIAAREHVRIPRLSVRKVTHHIYAVWRDRIGTAHCIEACCGINARNQYIATYLIVDQDEVELNRLYALEDPRLG